MTLGSTPRSVARAFTLLELLVVIGIVAILAGLLVMVLGSMRARAQRGECMANLRSLHIAADLYLQENSQWPQINVAANQGKTDEEFAELWITALQPYGPQRKTWICPSLQTAMGNPDYDDPANARIDYFTSSFDDKPTTPHEWAEQPWFIERANSHGKGNLIIFADGHIVSSDDFIRQ